MKEKIAENQIAVLVALIIPFIPRCLKRIFDFFHLSSTDSHLPYIHTARCVRVCASVKMLRGIVLFSLFNVYFVC